MRRSKSAYNFEVANTERAVRPVSAKAAAECELCLEAKLPIPAYEQAIKASHLFNTLQARGVISVAERQAYIGRVRDLAKAACAAWMEKNSPSPLAGEGAERSEAGEGAWAKRHAPSPSHRFAAGPSLSREGRDYERLPSGTPVRGNSGADAGEGSQRPRAAVRRMHERGGAGDRRGRCALYAAAAGADRARRRRGDRGEPRGSEGPARERSGAGARRISKENRPDARPARGARRRAVRGDRAGRARRGRGARGGGRAHRRRLPLAQVDALGRRRP